MLVFMSLKTMVVLLFPNDHKFTHGLVTKLQTHLSRQVPLLSQLIDAKVARPPPNQEDAIRFFYYSRMNLAIKLSNIVSKEILTIELKLTLNQMHNQFVEEPEC